MSYFTKTLQRILVRSLTDVLFCFVSLISVFRSLFLFSGSKSVQFFWGLCSFLLLDGHVFVLKQLPEASKDRRHEVPSLGVFCIFIAIWVSIRTFLFLKNSDQQFLLIFKFFYYFFVSSTVHQYAKLIDRLNKEFICSKQCRRQKLFALIQQRNVLGSFYRQVICMRLETQLLF